MKYPGLTELFRKYRPAHKTAIVFDISFNKPEDYNISLFAAEFDEAGEKVGETIEMLLAKSWLQENGITLT